MLVAGAPSARTYAAGPPRPRALRWNDGEWVLSDEPVAHGPPPPRTMGHQLGERGLLSTVQGALTVLWRHDDRWRSTTLARTERRACDGSSPAGAGEVARERQQQRLCSVNAYALAVHHPLQSVLFAVEQHEVLQECEERMHPCPPGPGCSASPEVYCRDVRERRDVELRVAQLLGDRVAVWTIPTDDVLPENAILGPFASYEDGSRWLVAFGSTTSDSSALFGLEMRTDRAPFPAARPLPRVVEDAAVLRSFEPYGLVQQGWTATRSGEFTHDMFVATGTRKGPDIGVDSLIERSLELPAEAPWEVEVEARVEGPCPGGIYIDNGRTVVTVGLARDKLHITGMYSIGGNQRGITGAVAVGDDGWHKLIVRRADDDLTISLDGAEVFTHVAGDPGPWLRVQLGYRSDRPVDYCEDRVRVAFRSARINALAPTTLQLAE